MAKAFNAEQVGSFLRPASVKEARTAFAAGTIDRTRLTDVEDHAILDAIDRQRRVGIDVYSDGEFRRSGFQTDFIESVEGYVPTDTPVPRIWQGPGGEPEAQGNASVVGSELKRLHRLTEVQTAFIKEHAPGPFKVTVPSPSQFPALGFQPGLTDKVYPTRTDLLWAIADIIELEMAALADSGVPYIQIDAPRYSYYVDPKWREYLRGLGEDPDQMLDDAVAADKSCVDAAKRDGVITALHVCRGNNQSKWYAEGGYEPIAEKLFGNVGVDRLLLEYDTERAGTFEPLRFVPAGVDVVLGLVSSKVGALESKGDVLRRIDEATKYLPIDRLALSPQCGFASMAAGNLLTEDDQWRKLELVVDVAREVWG
jgi:5-methyltetrahydropteroyltriglutamate--homocysteine methyltransferase